MNSERIFFFPFIVESGDRGVAADLQHNTRDTLVGVHDYLLSSHAGPCNIVLLFCKIKHCGYNIDKITVWNFLRTLQKMVVNHSRNDLYLNKDMWQFL